jgi:hypothetical protein
VSLFGVKPLIKAATIIAITALLLASAQAQTAQQEARGATLRGSVFDAVTMNKVGRVRIVLQDLTRRPVRQTSTSDRGEYELSNVQAGQ